MEDRSVCNGNYSVRTTKPPGCLIFRDQEIRKGIRPTVKYKHISILKKAVYQQRQKIIINGLWSGLLGSLNCCPVSKIADISVWFAFLLTSQWWVCSQSWTTIDLIRTSITWLVIRVALQRTVSELCKSFRIGLESFLF